MGDADGRRASGPKLIARRERRAVALMDWLTDLAKPKPAPMTYPDEREIGWSHPEHLVKRGLVRLVRTGQWPRLDDILADSPAWDRDIAEMYDLYRYVSNENPLLALAGAPPKDN